MVLGIINITAHLLVFIFSIITIVILIYNKRRLTLGLLGFMLAISVAILIINARLVLTSESLYNINWLIFEQNLFFLLVMAFMHNVIRINLRINHLLKKLSDNGPNNKREEQETKKLEGGNQPTEDAPTDCEGTKCNDI